jgi:hypothetical protein
VPQVGHGCPLGGKRFAGNGLAPAKALAAAAPAPQGAPRATI